MASLRAAFPDALVVDSAAPDHRTHLLRPDLGRRLADGTDLPHGDHDLVVVLADGLSAGAVNDHGPALVAALGHTGPVVLARHARVALGDDIGARLGARFVAVCIGERPGLTSPRSMGVYLTAEPRPGRTDAERNCISNISAHGQSPEAAAAALVWLLGEARRLGTTGVALKDRSAAVPGPLGPGTGGAT